MTYVRRHEVQSGSFVSLHDTALRIGEVNDCAVKAVAVVCGVSYYTAHETLASLGRRPKCGTHFSLTFNAVKKLGFTVTRDVEFISNRLASLRNRNYVVKNLTTRQLTMFPDLAQGGTWLAFTSSHVLAIKDGKVHCWGATKALRIYAVYRVV